MQLILIQKIIDQLIVDQLPVNSIMPNSYRIEIRRGYFSYRYSDF
jgi:hypothetical protein